MIATLVRQHIDEVLALPASRRALSERLARLAAAHGVVVSEVDCSSLVAHLESYVRSTPDLLEEVLWQATAQGIGHHIQPMIEAAAHYCLAAEDHIPDHEGLLGCSRRSRACTHSWAAFRCSLIRS